MKKFYLFVFAFLSSLVSWSQPCSTFTATAVTVESRCAATGKIIITAANGSGNYNYAVSGPVSTPFTNSDTINGLPAGSYQVFIRDVVTNCFFTLPTVVVPGTYQDPRFELTNTDVTCFNGNNGSVTVVNPQFGRPPFVYTIVAPSPFGVGQTDSNGVFQNLVPGTYFIQQMDSCGGIQTRNISIRNYDWFIDSATVTLQGCDSADISIILRDIWGNTNTTDTIFNSFTYGVITPNGDTINQSAYQFRLHVGTWRTLRLFARDACGNIKWVNRTIRRTPSVGNTVLQLNPNCNNFTAAITAQQWLTNPEYCLYDSTGQQLACNSTGVFDSLAWGSYCIRVRDLCYDTTITRCFTAVKPVPDVNAVVQVSYGDDCNVATASVTGQTNLFNPQFCLYDSADVLITCNTTGVFGNLPVGNYCIRITGSLCNDTTITRCFRINPVVLGGSTNVQTSQLDCNSFTGTIVGTVGFGNATYCLYNQRNELIRCNNTGVFDSLAFGSYCIVIDISRMTGGCADTSFTRCFTVTKPEPTLGSLSYNRYCSTFDVRLSSFSNIFNPQFCLFKDSVLIGCNTTGNFNGLEYGSYCLQVRDSCTDSLLTRCFTVEPQQIAIRASARASCTLDRTRISVTIDVGVAPFIVELRNLADSLLRTVNSSSRTINIDNVEAPGGERLRIIVMDSCRNRTEISVTPVVSFLNRTVWQTRNCPGGTFTQGSSDVHLNLVSNIARVIPQIISRNGVAVTIGFSTSNPAQTSFTFKDLAPGTYIIRSRIRSSCTITVFDTVVVGPYQYPSLRNSVLYRCDNNSFRVTAITAGGIGPFTYQVIGSVPASPAITTGPQTNPEFIINNGAAYTLVRLRVIDACGNASINDVSLVPFVNLFVSLDGGCMRKEATLRVDSIPNATYRWYRRIPPADSVLVATTPSFFIPTVTPADTGMYVCHVSVNSGCVVRATQYRLTGFCDSVLSDNRLKWQLNRRSRTATINWNYTNEQEVERYELQRRTANNRFITIHTRQAERRGGNYEYTDPLPAGGLAIYRIRVIRKNSTVTYSDQRQLQWQDPDAAARIYPNPAADQLIVQPGNLRPDSYTIVLRDLTGRTWLTQTHLLQAAQPVTLRRPTFLPAGYYWLELVPASGAEKQIVPVIFK